MIPACSRAAAPASAAGRTARRLGAVALVFLVVALTTWGLAADRPVAVATGEVEVPGGVLRLDAVRGELLQHDLMPMPGGLMPEMTPAGYARIWVDLTLVATGGETTWSQEDFSLVGPTGASLTPRRASVPPVVIPEGHAATFALQFEVPDASADDLVLRVADAERTLSLDLDAVGSPGHGH